MDTSIDAMKQIMSGIACLHDGDIIHRDIKPGNILVALEDPVVVKLTDFVVTKWLDPYIESSVMSSNVGTNSFKAPEFFMGNELTKINYHHNVDIYTAGLTFLAILQHKKGNSMLMPRIETPQDDSDLYLPIGQLIAERIKYKVKELGIVTSAKILINEVSTSEIIDHSLHQRYKIRKLIQTMTCHKPEERLSAGDVLNNMIQVRLKSGDFNLDMYLSVN